MKDDKVKGRYFYLMLKENFYDSDDMVLLESMENGYKYSNILLKLYLRSLKDKGKLMYKDRIPYSVEMLAKLTRHDPDTVRRAIEIFKNMGIIEILDNGAIFMMDIENYIGKSSTEADRRRAYDRRIATEKKELLLANNSEKPCENSCEKSHAHIDINTDINTNIDIEKDKKKDIYFANADINSLFIEFLEVRKKLKAVNSERAVNTLINTLNKYPDDIKYKMLENSIVNSWKSVYELKTSKASYQREEVVPEWMDKDIKAKPISKEQKAELDNMLAEYKDPNFEERKAVLQERLKNKYGKSASNA